MNRTVALLTALLFLLVASCVAGCVGAHTSARGARVVGLVEACGGPPPGRCGGLNGTSVAVLNAKHRLVAKEALVENGPGKFSFRLVPGRYTLVLTTDIFSGRRNITAIAGKTIRTNFIFSIP